MLRAQSLQGPMQVVTLPPPAQLCLQVVIPFSGSLKSLIAPVLEVVEGRFDVHTPGMLRYFQKEASKVRHGSVLRRALHGFEALCACPLQGTVSHRLQRI